MSELKELAWSVQESVEPMPFEQLERRGVRRRRRRQVLAGAGTAVAATVAVLTVLLPLGGNARSQQPPIAPAPTDQLPTTYDRTTIVKEGNPVVRSKTAQVRSVTMVTAGDWSAAWADCKSEPCRYGAAVSHDGTSVASPSGPLPFATLRVGDEPIAVAGPSGEALTPTDPTWSKTVLLRFNGHQTVLHYAEPTNTFGADEVLTDLLGGNGELRVLNLQDSTLRKLQVSGLEGARSPVRDGIGRWWVVTGKSNSGSRSDIAWTDDGGKTWDNTLLDPDNPAAKIAVSPNGRTIVASSWIDGATQEAIGLLRMSTDRGAHWTTVANKPWARGGGPVAFDDGSAVVLGQQIDDPSPSLYGISGGRAKLLNGVPDRMDDLAGDGRLLYGIQLESPIAQKVATSTDHGRTWQMFEPR